MSDVAELREIIARMRAYAPSLRGTGITASDASFNRTLRDADTLERLATKLDTPRERIAVPVFALDSDARALVSEVERADERA